MENPTETPKHYKISFKTIKNLIEIYDKKEVYRSSTLWTVNICEALELLKKEIANETT